MRLHNFVVDHWNKELFSDSVDCTVFDDDCRHFLLSILFCWMTLMCKVVKKMFAWIMTGICQKEEVHPKLKDNQQSLGSDGGINIVMKLDV